MRRTLSSAITPIVKVALPIWSAAFGFGVLRLLTRPSEVVSNGVRGGASVTDRVFILTVWLAVTLLLGRAVVRLRRVRVDGDALLVSNYLREVRVAFGEISEVTHVVGRRENRVTLTFRRGTPLGTRAMFLPAFGRDTEIVAELRKRAGLAPCAEVDSRAG